MSTDSNPGLDDQDVVGCQVGQGQPAVLVGGHVEGLPVQGRCDHVSDDVDERRRTGRVAGERDRRGGGPEVTLEQAAQVDVDVVPVDVDEAGPQDGLLPSEAGNG